MAIVTAVSGTWIAALTNKKLFFDDKERGRSESVAQLKKVVFAMSR